MKTGPLTLAAACAVALLVGCSSEPRSPSAERAEPAQPPSHSDVRLSNPTWEIVTMGTAHGDLIIHVNADDPNEAMHIAQSLTEPVKQHYVEVNVYIRRRGTGSEVPVRRVEWTAKGGYVVVDLEAEEKR